MEKLIRFERESKGKGGQWGPERGIDDDRLTNAIHTILSGERYEAIQDLSSNSKKNSM